MSNFLFFLADYCEVQPEGCDNQPIAYSHRLQDAAIQGRRDTLLIFIYFFSRFFTSFVIRKNLHVASRTIR
jgi:hypothetical protein